VPPGSQSNLASQMAAHAAYAADSAAAQAAVHSTTHLYRNAALLELANRLVGYLSEELLLRLGIQSSTTKVLISAASQRHAVQRRKLARKEDADLVVHRVSEAFSNLRYRLALPQQKQGTFALLGYVESAKRWVLLALKFVPAQSAASQADELWISTAFPYGHKRFRVAIRQGRLVDLLSQNLSAHAAPQP
jgi:hypothetical protein